MRLRGAAIWLGVFGLAGGGPALAQTELNLSASGDVKVQPDEIDASLNLQAQSANAADAQAQVNKAVEAALALAKNVPDVVATTGGYSVVNTQQDGTKPPFYQASQSLDLVVPAPGGVAPGDFTALLGRLQGDGLLLSNLDGELSDAARAAAQQQAVDLAIADVLAQARHVAGELKLHVARIETLSINTNAPGPVMFAGAATGPRMMMAKAEPPPQVAPDKIDVQGYLTATVALAGE